MLKALPYLAALLAVGLSFYSAYKWGYNDARADQLELTNEALAKSAQHIIDEQAKLQIVDEIINKSSDDTMLKSPILMRSLVSMSNECTGKTKC